MGVSWNKKFLLSLVYSDVTSDCAATVIPSYHCECSNIDWKSSQRCWPLDERPLPFSGHCLTVVSCDPFHPEAMEEKFSLEASIHHWRRHSTSTRQSPLISWLPISRNIPKYPSLDTSYKDPMANIPTWKKKKNCKSSSSLRISSRKATSRWLPAPAVNVSAWIIHFSCSWI